MPHVTQWLVGGCENNLREKWNSTSGMQSALTRLGVWYISLGYATLIFWTGHKNIDMTWRFCLRMVIKWSNIEKWKKMIMDLSSSN